MTWDNLSSIYLANKELVYWSVLSSSRTRGDGVKGMEEGNGYFSPLQFLLYKGREYQNLL